MQIIFVKSINNFRMMQCYNSWSQEFHKFFRKSGSACFCPAREGQSLLKFIPKAPCLKGLSHDIFRVIFWFKGIYLGLNGNGFWFLNFKEDSSILDRYFKY
jgi:hypothetical protein